MVRTAKGWGRRPARPDRIDYDPDKDYLTSWETVRTRNELEAIAYWMLRDDLDNLDPDTGKKKGLRGKDPILFDEHIYQRRRREILNPNGIPEPELVQGLYWRVHPDGRKVNSPEARERGAGYFR